MFPRAPPAPPGARNHMKIDLHAHTIASDGGLAARDLIQAAVRCRLDVIAVTDHDTTASLPEAASEAQTAGIRLVPGIEMSAQVEGTDVHILGYFLDVNAPGLADFLDGLRRSRRERILRVVDALGRAGIPIRPEHVFAEAKGDSVSRAHVARVLVKRGYARSTHHAFHRFLGKSGAAYVPSAALSPREAIRRIADSRGVSVLAHPGWLQDDGLIPSLVADGLDGIEAYYPDTRDSEVQRYLRIARHFRLLVTGGSDFHGGASGRGTTLGSIDCPEEDFRKLEARHHERTEAKREKHS